MRRLALSIGTNCEITFNIRNTFGLERAYPFDWWITPLNSVAGIIESQFSLDICDDNLEIVGDRASVLNKKWGLLHHHDFSREPETDLIGSDWRTEIGDVAEKYKALGERLFSDLVDAHEIIFYLNRSGIHQWYDKEIECDVSYRNIANAIYRLIPSKRWRIVVFHPENADYFRSDACDPHYTLCDDVIDYGDRWQGSQAHFAGSLRGWRERLEQIDDPVRETRPARWMA